MIVVRPGPLMKELGVNRHGLKIMREREGFPNPIKLGARSVGYLRAEVDGWLEMRKAERDAAAA
jgi:predicted DNA-binding transcriptional regulator AlpA